ncbi:SCO family protein [Verrucomicrobium sp. BvORR034]|uniref:SCO family protein n=1 Tax=Verrucomicrobium sp. BvORR034 TaxID=1396418 RepID=UPI0006794A97|nr:SCO family protein [Verrucomicrobium sp. BvORR034]
MNPTLDLKEGEDGAPPLPTPVAAPRHEASRPPIHLGVFWTLIVGICAVVAGFSWLMHTHLQKRGARPEPLPHYHRLGEALQAVERDGKAVSTASLEGKVRVFACLYTVCPHGCAAVMGQMRKLHLEHGDRSDLQLVSMTVLPERDTPELLTAYAESMGARESASWWFLSGQQASLWGFMTRGLGMNAPEPIPPDERLNPLDLYQHDLRVVLVDRAGWVRGYYEVFHPQPEMAALFCERLENDVRRLLEDRGL